MTSKLESIKKELRNASSPEKKKASEWFFKTGKGEYGYGDQFIGVTVPEQRKIAAKYKDIEMNELKELLQSKIHEERLTALLILVGKYEKSIGVEKENLFRFYISNLKFVNNWDLVDSSAHKIVGDFLLDKKITLLLAMAKSESLWERRVAIISTFAFLDQKNSKPTHAVADLLLLDREDLIQKAVGWALREVGKKVSVKELEEYLKNNYAKLGRTTLRYAIEKFDKDKRQAFISGNF